MLTPKGALVLSLGTSACTRTSAWTLVFQGFSWKLIPPKPWAKPWAQIATFRWMFCNAF